MCDWREHRGEQLAARCGGLGGQSPLINAPGTGPLYDLINFLKLINCYKQLHLRVRSDKKFGEKDSVANCQPTNIPISTNLVIWLFGEWSLNPSWPPPIVRTIRTNTNQGLGHMSGDREKSDYRVSINNLSSVFMWMPGSKIEPGTSVSVNKHATPTTPPCWLFQRQSGYSYRRSTDQCVQVRDIVTSPTLNKFYTMEDCKREFYFVLSLPVHRRDYSMFPQDRVFIGSNPASTFFSLMRTLCRWTH